MRLVKALYLGFSEQTVKKNQEIWNLGKVRAKEKDMTMSAHVLDLLAHDAIGY